MIRRAKLDLDDNGSLWAATAAPREPAPALVGEHTADLVIIGAGFTGLSTAWHVARRFPDRQVIILEAKTVGNGASGRNGGQALNWINGIEAHDPERARRVYEVTRGAIDWIEAVIPQLPRPVRFTRNGSLECATDSGRAEYKHERTELLASWGIPVQWVGGAALARRTGAAGVLGATFDPTTGTLHGLDFCRALAAGVEALGVTIAEGCPVVQIEEGATVTVTTPSATIRANAIVLGTNGYTPRLGYFRDSVIPMHSHVVATAPADAAAWAEAGWGEVGSFCDDLDRIAYATLTPTGHLLFGGGSNQAYDYTFGGSSAWRGPDRSAAVEQRLRAYFPKVGPITHRWSGTLGITLSRMCTMGVRGTHKNVYYALGYSGHGVALANLAGAVLCDLYSDHPEPWRDLPFMNKRLFRTPPEPFRWTGYQLFTRLTGRSPRHDEA